MVEFGVQVTPTAAVGLHRELVAAAEEGGLDLVAVQDHPYAPSQIDALTLIGDLLARTERLRFFPDVSPLPLRPPGLLAQSAAALDVLSGGRFELGLGAGGFQRGITGIGGPDRTPAEALEALAEGIGLLRRLWTEPDRVVADGKYYPLNVRTGPLPLHDIAIWVGSVGPRSMQLTGRLADGWAAPIPRYLPYDGWAGANAIIDEAAKAAGRDPAEVVRIAQIVGTITDGPGDTDTTQGDAPLRGTPDQWAAFFARLATEQPFRTFIFWPEQHDLTQITRFAADVVPATKALLT
ncbi:luciferase-like monooxygenase [Kribbella steppae]|uniref:Luciferase-like monooxygenase n=1 Tax=Kribbella steppae TaxID=2512223 RepID=A0A4R2HNJ9_9ACTN|nr:LLM class flavin-dependent oxidoreductase [Kribbella steppae]TCO32436.1 luciferase-like monooxygenase [Kribbella steppae]